METRSGYEVFQIRGKENIFFYKNSNPKPKIEFVRVEFSDDGGRKDTPFTEAEFKSKFGWNNNLRQLDNSKLNALIVSAIIDSELTLRRMQSIKQHMTALNQELGKPV